jgi:hypothetical protein
MNHSYNYPWRGDTSPQLQKFTGRYSPTSGWSYDQEFSGLDPIQMQTLADIYRAVGCEYDLSYGDGKATLRTVDNRGNITIDTWEIGVNHTSKSSLQNPNNGVALAYQEIIARALKDGEGLDAAVQALDDDMGGDVYPEDIKTDPASMRLWKRMLNGQDTYNFDQYVLRHTTNASNRGYYNVADANVNKIYTYSQFLNEITNGGYWFFPAPNEILGALSVIFGNLATPKPYFLQGALKSGSPRSTAANNRINIVTEYAIDVWSSDEYRVI